MNLKNRIFLIVFQTLYLLVLFIVLPTFVITTRQGDRNLAGNELVNINTNTIYQQEFTSSNNGLNSISIFLKNPALQNRQDFNLKIIDDSKTVLRQLKFNGYNIGDPSWLPFKFEPIPNSHNQTYLLTLSTSDTPKDQISWYYNPKTEKYIFKTTFTPLNRLDPLQNNISFQKQQIQSRSIVLNWIYLSSIILLNIYLLIL